MNLTAVQLHPQLPRGEIAFGTPARICPGARGPVALFAPDSLVAYELRFARRRRLFVFRTLLVEDRLAAAVPGVHRRVRLLVQLRTAARIARLRAVLAGLVNIGCPLDHLDDGFFARLGAILDGRRPPSGLGASLLHREPPCVP